MVKFKIESLKNNAANNIRFSSNNKSYNAQIYAILETMDEHPRTWRDVLPEMEQAAKNIVYKWDARCIMKLVKIFPFILPKKYHGQKGILEYNEKGEWILIF